MKDFLKGIFKFVGVLLILALIVGGVLYSSFVTVLHVGHSAMAPTTVLGDQVLVWNSQEFGLGEVALCAHPERPGEYVMGRVVGRPGHTVSFERGGLCINGDAPYTDLTSMVSFFEGDTRRTHRMRLMVEDILGSHHRIFVREGHTPSMRRPHEVKRGLFLLNDNRSFPGEDSRTYGEVEPSACIGRVIMRLKAADAPAELGHAALDIIR